MDVNVGGDVVRKSVDCKGGCSWCKKKPYLVKKKGQGVRYCYEFFIDIPKLVTDSERSGGNRVLNIDRLKRDDLSKLSYTDPEIN